MGVSVKLGWLSDIHLNFLDEGARRRFHDELADRNVDAWVISGDIGEAPSVGGYLRELGDHLRCRTLFILGNHDFYSGSIKQVVGRVAGLSRAQRRLIWMTQSPPVLPEPGVAIVGDDGWSDGRLGDPLGTPVELNDFYLIEELAGHSREELVRRLNTLGDKAAERLEPKLQAAARVSRFVVVVTHAPPFAGATWHEGRQSSPEWLPWFSCDALGRAITACAQRFSGTEFLVLCGHTHSPGVYHPLDNVVVHTAAAEYGRPHVQAVIEL
jgi:predicted MPP superfamily phosphohydrolase